MRHPTTRKFPFIPAPETEIEELIADICDNKCKYIETTRTWEEMADLCTTCPMVKIYEKLIEKNNTGCRFKSKINCDFCSYHSDCDERYTEVTHENDRGGV